MFRVTGGAAVAAALLVGLTGPARAQTQPLKLAYINSQVILNSAPGRAQAESTFQKDLAGYQARVNVLQTQYDSAVSEFTRTSLVLSPAAKQQKQQDLLQMQQRTQQEVRDLQDSATAREQQLMAPIMQRIQAVIDGIRAEYNYALIFDAASQGGAIVSADRALDISPLVIQRLQAGGGAAPAVQPSPAPPLPDTASRPPARQARPSHPQRP